MSNLRGNNTHVRESGNLLISLEVIQKATNNFASENQIGHEESGVVYKGELDDGTKISVKRMAEGVISSKQMVESQAEIDVLSKIFHRHIVSLFGYAMEGNKKVLVYEYLPRGPLSNHLFYWKSLNLDPLSWKRRLSIALDVARGMEYVHSLATQSYIHRDLKSSNILLDNKYRAKVSGFRLVKHARNRESSVTTTIDGTFGYLAPECVGVVVGKVTSKADVFSFGVVLMELLMGLTALDDNRSEDRRYLVEWFSRVNSTRHTLIASIDPAMEFDEEDLESIFGVADLAGHCTERDPHCRPHMEHIVTVLASLVGKRKLHKYERTDYSGGGIMPISIVNAFKNIEGR